MLSPKTQIVAPEIFTASFIFAKLYESEILRNTSPAKYLYFLGGLIPIFITRNVSSKLRQRNATFPEAEVRKTKDLLKEFSLQHADRKLIFLSEGRIVRTSLKAAVNLFIKEK